jgi:tRNA-splicing ligase RtcB
MIHSGSRNLGLQVAKHYNEIAVELNGMWYSAVPKKWDLAFLPLETLEAKAYLREMDFCVEYAFANRRVMMNKVVMALADIFPDLVTDDFINIAHNYATLENHYGENVMVHRKGATRAYEGELGIIPGSQGTKSYIVKGKGNPESFKSCSHGAGRKMGRGQAQRELNLEEEIKKLDEQGIVHGIRSVKDLDEASGAYKNVDEVMKNQEDLVSIEVELKTLGVIKG